MAVFGNGAGQGGLYGLVAQLQQIGFYDILLPFLLVFTISFAVLQKVKIFGAEARKINAIVALVIGFLFLQNSYLSFILQRFLPNMSLIMIAALMLLLLVGIFAGGAFTGFGGVALNTAFVLSLVATLIAISVDFFPGSTGGGILEWFYILFPDPGTQQLIILVIIIVITVAVVASEKKGNEPNTASKFLDEMRKGYGK